MSAWPFSVLEVAADASERDIKRAYARKLKTVHPEDDPAGFQALREAYEAALSGQWSQGVREDFQPPVAEPAFDETPAHGQDQPPRGQTYVPQSTPHDEELWALEEALLYRLGDPDASDEDKRAALDAVLASPALENVGRMSEVEAWVGTLIADHPGVTDCLLDRAVARFGWDRDRRWDTAWFAAAAVARRDALVFARRLHDPKNPLHRGYSLLQSPPGGWFSVFLQSNEVRPVLRLLDREPGLQPEFEYETVQRWREALDRLPFNRPEGKRSIWRFVFLIFWIGLIIVKCTAVLDTEETTRPPERVAQDVVGACRDAARAPALMPAAQSLCADALLRDDYKIAALNDSALVYLRLEDWGTAKTLYDSALKLSPNDARALYGHGLAQFELGLVDEARADIARALRIDAKAGEAFAAHGVTAAPGLGPIDPASGGPPVQGRRGAVYRSAVWTSLPSANDISRHYPARALREDRAGRVILDCAVVAGGTLADCFVLRETPGDMGFADAALALSRQFHLAASGEAWRDGTPFRVTFAVRFEMEGKGT